VTSMDAAAKASGSSAPPPSPVPPAVGSEELRGSSQEVQALFVARGATFVLRRFSQEVQHVLTYKNQNIS
jgi:hypothetical protein